MGILDELLGGGKIQKDYKDFVDRYEQGDPSEGYSDQEVLKRYGEVSHAVPPDQYAKAAQEALGKLSPEDRAEFLKMLQERAAARGVTLPREVASDPKDLGKVLTDLHEKPGQLRDILGGGPASGASAPASGASAGVEPDRRHTEVPAGQGRARGHRGHVGQAHQAGFVPNGVRPRRSVGFNEYRPRATHRPFRGGLLLRTHSALGRARFLKSGALRRAHKRSESLQLTRDHRAGNRNVIPSRPPKPCGPVSGESIQ